jgi:ATP-dependent protease ClpP protease subunit
MKTMINPQARRLMEAAGLPRVFALAPRTADSERLEMTIYDLIGTDETNAGTFAAALQDAGGRPLTIRLSSGGGSVFEGWAMAAALRKYPGASTVVVDGVCASIATCIALAADEVFTAETSLWMVHNAWTAAVGSAGDFRDMAETLDLIDENLAQVYARATGGTAAHWAKLMAAESWFNAETAVAAGLCQPEPLNAQALSRKPAVHASLSGMIDQLETGNQAAVDLSALRPALDAAMAVVNPPGDRQYDAELAAVAETVLASIDQVAARERAQRRHLARLKAL